MDPYVCNYSLVLYLSKWFIVWFFSSSRGLRQGDLLSPYLFIDVMEGFNALLMRSIVKLGFDFHPSYTALQLTHVCFDVDLFIVVGATEKSFRTIKQSLNEFGKMASLLLNLDKSQCFFAGITDELEARLGIIMCIPIGKLPVRYLEVPLTISAISTKDCRSLIVGIKNKIEIWRHKKVNYVGRVVLINSVLFGASNYWAQCSQNKCVPVLRK
ncbi:hypothetical protein LIER_07292 [Lithospermum erythrorhizon]|uniref:Reverse transcriptase domain-containing protein n=1 Tax=Lithospermum erythrorhizon TaxID=34254 RepID=A0AAV3P7Q7_LITER